MTDAADEPVAWQGFVHHDPPPPPARSTEGFEAAPWEMVRLRAVMDRLGSAMENRRAGRTQGAPGRTTSGAMDGWWRGDAGLSSDPF